MKKIIIFLLFSLTLISCLKKQHKVKVIKNVSDLNELFQLKNYKTQVRMKVNDSIDHITAQWDNFTLMGDLNTKMNEKTGIWTLKNKTDSKKIEIDYIAFGKKDIHKNQILFYDEKGELDSLKSKFYTSKIISEGNKKKLVFSFFSSRNSNEKFSGASVNYLIGRNSKTIKEDRITLKDGNGIYRVKIDFDFTGFKKQDGISGFFSEFVTSKVPGDSIEMGNNTIFFKKEF